MYLENFEFILVVVLFLISMLLLLILALGIVEFIKAKREFKAMLRERQKINNQLKK